MLDATSRWPEVIATNSKTLQSTIAFLQSIFARFGVPVELVSDNGPQLTSEEFQSFVKYRGIIHRMGAPYYPQTDGLAEWMVQSVKLSLSKIEHRPGSFQLKLLRFLLNYRNTPHYATGSSPASLLLGREIRTHLDLIRPTPTLTTFNPVPSIFQIGQHFYVRDYRLGHAKWHLGVVIKRFNLFVSSAL